MSILVVGSIAYDTIETPNGKMDDALGGSTLFFTAAASLFAQINVVGVIGSDFQKEELKFLEQRDVNFDGLYVEEGKTFRWGGRYHKNMNQRDTLFTDLNVFEYFNPTIPEQYKNCEYIFLANIAPELQLQVLEQVNNPKLVVLDTMNLWINISRDALEQVVRKSDIVIINDEELMQFTEEENLVKAVKKIVAMGPSKLVIKRGEYGALLYSNNKFFFAPAYPLENVVDPTGAGDTFAGGFLGYLASTNEINDETLRHALVYGCTTASFTVEDFGLLNLKNLSKEQLESRFDEFKEMMVL
ncbi:MAG: sugar kinase [Calditrichaeota bacterium]|nr:MAG: sugar kinase [Calditrichota bacterium]MBL1204716.1 sugar kinase [Calditrichota bacterium]NOG44544.1 sugar kinase [Calditrichota bacterium]